MSLFSAAECFQDDVRTRQLIAGDVNIDNAHDGQQVHLSSDDDVDGDDEHEHPMTAEEKAELGTHCGALITLPHCFIVVL